MITYTSSTLQFSVYAPIPSPMGNVSRIWHGMYIITQWLPVCYMSYSISEEQCADYDVI